jgi:transposase
LSDAQWEVVAPVLHAACGRSGRLPRRELLNAIFYVLRTGCQWRFLPQSYPKWNSVHSCFRRWSRNGTLDQVVEALRVEVRYAQGRTAWPTAAVIDTQSVKTTEKGGLGAMTEPRSSVGANG